MLQTAGGAAPNPVESLSGTGSIFLMAAATSLIANVSGVIWLASGILLIALLLLMTIELGTAYLGTSRIARKGFRMDRRITGKVMLLILVAVSFIIDVVIYTAVDALPDHFYILDSGFLFATLTSLIWLNAAEVLCIIQNVAKSEGGEAVPPQLMGLANGIQWVIRSMKIVDKARWNAEHPGEPMPGRWKDGLTIEQEAYIAAEVERMIQANKPIPTDPVKIIEQAKIDGKPDPV